MRSRALLLAAVVFTACRPAPPTEEQTQAATDSARAAVDEGNARWVRYVNAGTPDSIAQLYTADGVAMPGDVPAATGHDSIIARLRPLVIPGGTLTITSQSVSVHGPMAVSRGVWAYRAPAQGSTPAVNLVGKFMEHWHRTNDGWKIVENIWNTDAPAPQPAARR